MGDILTLGVGDKFGVVRKRLKAIGEGERAIEIKKLMDTIRVNAERESRQSGGINRWARDIYSRAEIELQRLRVSLPGAGLNINVGADINEVDRQMADRVRNDRGELAAVLRQLGITTAPGFT